MQSARRFKKDWDGNRKRDTALRCTEHQLGDCNIFIGVAHEINADPTKPGTRAVSVLFSQRAASFQLPGGVLILAHPETDGGNEVKQ